MAIFHHGVCPSGKEKLGLISFLRESVVHFGHPELEDRAPGRVRWRGRGFDAVRNFALFLVLAFDCRSVRRNDETRAKEIFAIDLKGKT